MADVPLPKKGGKGRLAKTTLLQNRPFFRKIFVSVKFVSAILGPEMGAPILWTPGKCVLSAGKTMSVKFPFFGGGGGVPILFLWARGFF